MPKKQHEHIFEIVREIGTYVKKKCIVCGFVKFFIKDRDET